MYFGFFLARALRDVMKPRMHSKAQSMLRPMGTRTEHWTEACGVAAAPETPLGAGSNHWLPRADCGRWTERIEYGPASGFEVRQAFQGCTGHPLLFLQCREECDEEVPLF